MLEKVPKIFIPLYCFFVFSLASNVVAQENKVATENKNIKNQTEGISPNQSLTSTDLDFSNFSPPNPGTLEWETFWQEWRDKLILKRIDLNTWVKQVSIYFKSYPFTPAHLEMWDVIIQQTPEFQSDLLMYATVFVSLSLLSEVHKQTPLPAPLVLSSQFLLKNLGNLKESQISQLVDIIDSELKKTPVQLTQLWDTLVGQSVPAGISPTPDTLASLHEAMIYLCMCLTAYLPPGKFLSGVQLPEPMRGFFSDFNILLFDGGMFTEAHYRSLRSIFSCLPPGLHDIKMMIVPEGVGVSATRLLIPPQYGIVTDMPFLPMEVMSNPAEFPPNIGAQVAPEFSLQAVVQIVRAIQHVQFGLRPELLFRRNTLLMEARPRNYNYIRRTIRPEVYFNNPDELLPLSSYLWFLNSENTLKMANDLLKIRQHFVTDVYLLLADMLSEGRSVTLTFYMDETGYLSVREAPVIRVPIDEGYPAVISILPERIVPSSHFNIEKMDNILIPDESLIQPTQQGGDFKSGFSVPVPKEVDIPLNEQIIIEPRGN